MVGTNGSTRCITVGGCNRSTWLQAWRLARKYSAGEPIQPTLQQMTLVKVAMGCLIVRLKAEDEQEDLERHNEPFRR